MQLGIMQTKGKLTSDAFDKRENIQRAELWIHHMPLMFVNRTSRVTHSCQA